jgi:hypothetical protein
VKSVRPPGRHLPALAFQLEACHGELQVTHAHIDAAIAEHFEGALSPEDASIAEWWATESRGRIVAACLQLHAGSNELMLEICGRWLGLREPRG